MFNKKKRRRIPSNFFSIENMPHFFIFWMLTCIYDIVDMLFWIYNKKKRWRFMKKVELLFFHNFNEHFPERKKVTTNLWIWTHILVLERQLTSNLFSNYSDVVQRIKVKKYKSIWCLGKSFQLLLSVWALIIYDI
jgi:hypothetical protein